MRVNQLTSATAVFERARESGCKKLLCFLSGGKDSLATLSLAVDHFGHRNVVAVFMYFVRGLRCVEQHIDAARQRHKVEILYVPHFTLGGYFKNSVCMPPRRDAHSWRITKLIDIEQHVRAQTGIEWIAGGHKMVDSLERRGMLNSFQGVNPKSKRLYPLWQWNHAAVLSYLRAKRIPIPGMFGNASVSDIDLRPRTLWHMREEYPDDYQKVKEVFPYCDAVLAREEFRRVREKNGPETVIEKAGKSGQGSTRNSAARSAPQ